MDHPLPTPQESSLAAPSASRAAGRIVLVALVFFGGVAASPAEPGASGPTPLDQLAAAILNNDLATANRLINGPTPDAAPEDWAAIAAQARRIIDWPTAVCASFQADIGKPVSITSSRGTASGTVASVGANEIRLRVPVENGFVGRTVSVLTLADPDRDSRLVGYSDEEKMIITALVFLRSGRTSEATEALQNAAASPLAPHLLATLQRIQFAELEEEATSALRRLLDQAGFGDAREPNNQLLAAIRTQAFGPVAAPVIQKLAADFTARFGLTHVAYEWAAITAALATIGPRPQVLEETEVEKAIAALKTKNRIEGDLLAFPEIHGGRVDLILSGNERLKDISGLEKLPVRDLDLTGTGVRSLLPLKSMPLERLILDGTPITSLRGIEGCPIRSLSMTNTAISDLKPLKGAPLESANLNRSQVRSLAGLEGAPLSDLNISETPVSDIKALAGAPLTNLNASVCAALTDIRPLASSPLQYLYLWGSGVFDFRPIAKMPLRVLHCMRLEDLGLLAEAPLEWLIISYSGLTDLRPLGGKPITSLSLTYCPKLSDLSPLRGMPLVTLDLTDCPKINDLAPLQGMPLTTLVIDGTSLDDKDMAAIADALPNLVTLFMARCKKINSLDFLISLKSLAAVSLPPGVNAVPALEKHPSITAIYENGVPIDVKEYIASHGGGTGK